MTDAVPLRRPHRDRMVAGVIAGLARHYVLDVALLRIIYVLFTIFTAFAGAVLYLVLWVVIPADAVDDAR